MENEEPLDDEFADFIHVDSTVDEPVDEFADFQPIEPSITDKAVVAGQAALGGAVEAGGVLGGGLAGFRAGMPGGPWGMAAGTLVGATAGYFAGGEARSVMADIEIDGRPLTYGSAREVSPELRPYYFAGEAIGGSLPFMGLPFGIGASGVKFGGRIGGWLNNVIQGAMKRPKTFLGIESSAAISSGIAGGAMEAHLPGETPHRIGAEIVAGVVNPTRMIVNGTVQATSRVKSAVATLNSVGRETQAGRLLVELIESYGEDPELLARILSSRPVEGLEGLTAAQMTGSKALGAMEKALGNYSAKFGADAKRAGEEGLEAIRGMIRLLHGTGDPQAFKAAAAIRSTYFKTLLQSRLDQAQQTAMDAAAKISRDTPAARAKLSRLASTAIDEVYKSAKRAEQELWEAIPEISDAPAPILLDEVSKFRAEMIPGETLPSLVESFSKAVKEEGAISTKKLLRFRSKMSEAARKAANEGDMSDARMYGLLADAALEDVDVALKGVGAGDLHEQARTFTREMHEAFTRTFVGRAGATDRYGQRMPVEVMLKQALATGREIGELQLRQLEEATKFMEGRGVMDNTALLVMMDAQERMIRLAARESIDPVSGTVNVKQLKRYMDDSEALMNRFPGIKADLEKAIDSQLAAQDIQRATTNSARVIDQQAAFSRLTKVEDPAREVSNAIRGKRPIGDLSALMKLAKRGGSDAIEGFKASIYDAAVDNASTATGELSLDKMRQFLLEPISRGQPSLMGLMERQGIIQKGDVTAIKRLFDDADKITQAMKTAKGVDELETTSDFLIDLIQRIGGAKLAGWVSGATGSRAHELIVAGAGVRAAQSVLSKVPQSKIRYVLIEAMKNPDFAAQLLSRSPVPGVDVHRVSQVHAYLLQAGLLGSEPATGDEQ